MMAGVVFTMRRRRAEIWAWADVGSSGPSYLPLCGLVQTSLTAVSSVEPLQCPPHCFSTGSHYHWTRAGVFLSCGVEFRDENGQGHHGRARWFRGPAPAIWGRDGQCAFLAGGGQVLFLVLEVPAAPPEVLALMSSHSNGEK